MAVRRKKGKKEKGKKCPKVDDIVEKVQMELAGIKSHLMIKLI